MKLNLYFLLALVGAAGPPAAAALLVDDDEDDADVDEDVGVEDVLELLVVVAGLLEEQPAKATSAVEVPAATKSCERFTAIPFIFSIPAWRLPCGFGPHRRRRSAPHPTRPPASREIRR